MHAQWQARWQILEVNLSWCRSEGGPRAASVPIIPPRHRIPRARGCRRAEACNTFGVVEDGDLAPGPLAEDALGKGGFHAERMIGSFHTGGTRTGGARGCRRPNG